MGTPPIGGGPLDPNQPAGGNQSKATGVPNMGPVQDALNTMAESSLRMAETMERVLDRMEALAKSAGVVSDKVKDAVSEMSDMETNIKAAISSQKDFNNNVRNQKRTYEEVKAHLEKVLSLNKQLLISNKDNVVATKALEGNAKALEKAYEQVSKQTKAAKANTVAEASALKELNATLANVTRSHVALAAAEGKVVSSRLEQHIIGLNRAYRDAGMQVKIFENLEKAMAKNRAQISIKQALQEHKQGKRQDIQAMFAKAAGPAAAHLGVDLARNKAGGIDWAAMRSRRAAPTEVRNAAGEIDYGEMAKKVAYRGGSGIMGSIDKALTERALRTRAMAQVGGEAGAPGMLGKAGVALSEAGGGSVVGGAVESGLGAVAEMAPQLAAGMAVFKVISNFIDKVAITNQAIEKGMGGALFTPGMTGGQALNTVRQNLSANLFNAYGQNLEKNLAIAQAMQEQGLDITEISRGDIREKGLPSGRQVDRGAGFLGGAFGEFQSNAMTAGRNIGLTDQQTVVRMTKMLQEMRQTFEATHDFLENVNTSARAAGISTTKYLAIVDDLTAQFDKMNKSFSESVNIINALGAAGTATADNLTDMAKALTGAGEQKTVEQKAAAFNFMTPDVKKGLVEAQQGIIDESVGNLSKALGAAKVDVSDLNLTKPADLMALQGRIAQLPNGLQKQNLQSASDAAQAAITQMNRIIIPGTQGGGRGQVEAAYGTQLYGEGAAVKAAQQVSLLKEGLKIGGQDFADVLKHPDTINAISAAAASTLGYKPEDLINAARALNTIGAGGTEHLKNMAEGPARDRELQRFWNYGKKANLKGFGGQYDKKTLEDALNNSEMSQQLNKQYTEDLGKNSGLALSVLAEKNATQDKAAQDQQVKDVALETRTTADIYANAFEKFFSMLVDAIMGIKHLLDWKWGKTEEGVAAGTAKTIDDFKQRGMMDLAEKEMRDRSAGGDDAAQRALSRKQAYEMSKPENRTEAQALDYQQIVQAYASTAAAASMGPKMTDEQWQTLKQEPGISQQALEEQAIRGISDQGVGGTFGDKDNKFWLGQTLQGAQLDTVNKMLGQAGLGSIATDQKSGAQYINITMNSTDIQAFMNRFGLKNVGAVNKSNELATGNDALLEAQRKKLESGQGYIK